MARPAGVPWTSRATHVAGRRAVGGSLSLTPERLVFEPNALERRFRARRFEAPLSAIASVEVARRRIPRTRMFVRLADGSEASFIVRRPRDRARDLDALLGS